jgi:hypothetical protein
MGSKGGSAIAHQTDASLPSSHPIVAWLPESARRRPQKMPAPAGHPVAGAGTMKGGQPFMTNRRWWGTLSHSIAITATFRFCCRYRRYCSAGNLRSGRQHALPTSAQAEESGRPCKASRRRPILRASLSTTGKDSAMTTPAERNAQEIAALLAAEGHDLAEDQIVAITDFIQQVGSVERAKAAVEALSELRRAA